MEKIKITDSLKPGRPSEKPPEATTGSFEELAGMPVETIAALIHNLRAHQTELKMQNNELRRLQQELENKRDRYAHLYDFSPVGYFSITEKGIVRNHNGAIFADNEFEKGTAFHIFLPVIKDEPARKVSTVEDVKTGKERILYVDDEESLVEIVSQILDRLGYRVEATTNPFDALNLFRANSDKFDLVITDLTMPGMSGDKLVKEILAIRPEMPIILCSGFSDKISSDMADELGIRAFIMKPVVIREMAGTIRKVLDQN